jgi:hypothetical protein
MTRTLGLLGGLIALFGLHSPARADSYYVIVFGAQSKPQRPKYSHSWAAFVRVPGEACDGPPPPDAGPPEVVSISWLPRRGVDLQVNALFAEEGFNFDQPATFQIVLEQCEYVSAWGPYQIKPELFRRAVCQAQRLQRGEVQYKTLDYRYNTRYVCNCIHALTYFNDQRRLRIGRLNFGEVASYYITDSYEDWICNKCRVHSWVADLLGLGQYPIRWRMLQEGRPWPRKERLIEHSGASTVAAATVDAPECSLPMSGSGCGVDQPSACGARGRGLACAEPDQSHPGDHFGSGPSRRLRVGCPPSFADHLSPPVAKLLFLNYNDRMSESVTGQSLP